MDGDVEPDCPYLACEAETLSDGVSLSKEENVSDGRISNTCDFVTACEPDPTLYSFYPFLENSSSDVSNVDKYSENDSRKISRVEREKEIKNVQEDEILHSTDTIEYDTDYHTTNRTKPETLQLCSKSSDLTCNHAKQIAANVYKVRKFFDVRDGLKNNLTDKTVKTYGSMAEGIVLSNSKIDIMYTLNWILVQYQPSISSNDLTPCVLQAEPSCLGYVCLIVLSGWDYELISTSTIKRDDQWYLSSSLFHVYMKNQSPSTCTELGFRFTDVDESFTYTFVLYSVWPEMIRESFPRKERNGWPSESTIQKLIRDGVTLLPSSNKESDDIGLQWKLSFNTAETTLTRNISDDQLLALIVLKSYLSNTLSEYIPSNVMSTSYLAKTTMFWVVEETNGDNFSSLIMACCERFVHYLETRRLPNYFIPDENLLEDIKVLPGQILTACLSKLRSIDIRYFMNHSDKMSPDMTHIVSVSYGDEMILSFLPLMQVMYHQDFIQKTVKRILTNTNDVFIQSLYSFYLSQQNQFEAQKLVLTKGDNKTLYSKKRYRLALLLIGTNTDTLSGWILVAFHFLNVGDYRTYIEIGEYLDSKRRTTENKLTYHCPRMQLSFFKKLRCQYVKPALRIKGSQLIPLEESTDSGDYSLIPSDILLYYLKFLLLMNTGYETMCPELLIEARERQVGYHLSEGMSMAADMVFRTMEKMLIDNDH